MTTFEKYSWKRVGDFVSGADAIIQEQLLPLPDLLKASNSDLSRFGGDPGNKNWGSFRPLASSREETWSDWLQFLIENSGSGFLALELLGRKLSGGIRAEKVEREICAEGKTDSDQRRRADILVYWSNGYLSNIEVKLGDKNFAKTHETAEKLHAKIGGERWTDHILVPGAEAAAWGRESDKIRGDFGFPVELLTWEEVAVALRRALYAGREAEVWLSMAYVFCGCIEEIALGLPGFGSLKRRGVSFHKFKAAKRVDILAKAVRKNDR